MKLLYGFFCLYDFIYLRHFYNTDTDYIYIIYKTIKAIFYFKFSKKNKKPTSAKLLQVQRHIREMLGKTIFSFQKNNQHKRIIDSVLYINVIL